MNLGEAKEMFKEYLQELKTNQKCTDKTIEALELINEHLNQTIAEETIEEPDLWISTKSDLLIVAHNKQLRIYQKRN